MIPAQKRTGEGHPLRTDQWADLLPVLDHPHLPIDNNPVERAIHGTAVGKKNQLFFGPGESGQVSAGYYTQITTAKEHGLDPFRYLEDLFEALPSLPPRSKQPGCPPPTPRPNRANRSATPKRATPPPQELRRAEPTKSLDPPRLPPPHSGAEGDWPSHAWKAETRRVISHRYDKYAADGNAGPRISAGWMRELSTRDSTIAAALGYLCPA